MSQWESVEELKVYLVQLERELVAAVEDGSILQRVQEFARVMVSTPMPHPHISAILT